MSERCPTCSQPLAAGTISSRMLALMVREGGRPLTSAEIARTLGVQRTTIYQTTRRMMERGSIRKATMAPHGTGWVIVQQESIVDMATERDMQDQMREVLEGLVQDLVAYVGAVQSIPRPAAIDYLQRVGGIDGQTAGDLIDIALQSQRIRAEGINLVDA
jgi:predicted transcriptional regulator